MPNLAHTILWEKRGLELDNFVGFDIYSQNQTTNYTSGTVFHWDGMLVQYLSKRFGFGAILSNLTQITNDRGPLTNQLHGFEGRAWGAGPGVLLGHLLLGTSAHSRYGLMAGRWRATDLDRASLGDLRFSPAEAAIMRAEAARRWYKNRETTVANP